MIKTGITPWAPHGKALAAYWDGDQKASIGIRMIDDSITHMPIEIYFREFDQFPEIEQLALSLCKGTVLDVGAGVGAHCLALQSDVVEAVGLDIVPEACEIMKARGVKNVFCDDFLNFSPKRTYDTLLFLMNGIGIAGSIEGLNRYLQHALLLTHHNSQIILDSSDLRQTDLVLDFSKSYFGEIDYQLVFKGETGEPYQWLYIDQEKLIEVSQANQWHCEIIYEQEDGSYLARLTKQATTA